MGALTDSDPRARTLEPVSMPDAVPADLVAFVERHYDRLMGLARLVCRDASDAADAVQAGVEIAWRQQASLRDPASLKPWLDRIVVREAARLARGRRSWS